MEWRKGKRMEKEFTLSDVGAALSCFHRSQAVTSGWLLFCMGALVQYCFSPHLPSIHSHFVTMREKYKGGMEGRPCCSQVFPGVFLGVACIIHVPEAFWQPLAGRWAPCGQAQLHTRCAPGRPGPSPASGLWPPHMVLQCRQACRRDAFLPEHGNAH